jgi:hypothetical protein
LRSKYVQDVEINLSRSFPNDSIGNRVVFDFTICGFPIETLGNDKF